MFSARWADSRQSSVDGHMAGVVVLGTAKKVWHGRGHAHTKAAGKVDGLMVVVSRTDVLQFTNNLEGHHKAGESKRHPEGTSPSVRCC